MARERSRLQCGHFRTPPRVITALSKLIKPSPEGNVTVLDCCCGTGEAVAELKAAWGSPVNVKTYGVEVDRGRAEAAEHNLDEVLWSAIEESYPSACCSMMLANYPYDQVRDEGRLEALLFGGTKDWPMRKRGVLVLIVPQAVLKERYSDLAHEVEKHYDVKAVFNFPLPEFNTFRQSILLGVRREKEQPTSWDELGWATQEWPELPLEAERPRWTLHPSATVNLRRAEVSDEILLATTSKSPLKHALLREAMAPEQPLARPVLPLRPGHIALVLASGCETWLDNPVHGKFGVKGSLRAENRKVGSEEKLDADGEPCAIVDRYRTTYTLHITALRATGAVETFTSEPKQELVNTEGEDA